MMVFDSTKSQLQEDSNHRQNQKWKTWNRNLQQWKVTGKINTNMSANIIMYTECHRGRSMRLLEREYHASTVKIWG